ncbi:N-terminal kinase-like protein [Neocloeon triangulifer]|uniref:N-terminal kinase-like protein n=1 Tax=Neocloeon triangulifer TaxID=2078957 RepID=UPI00286F0006|nr:N-terminal kinase-like protein [Neocloeon triangulifer]
MWSFFARDPTKDFPFEIGEVVWNDLDRGRSLWSIHKGKKKSSGDEVSVFSFDAKTGAQLFELAKGAMKRFKTLRHPYILPYFDGFESDKGVFFATESVEPLESHLSKLSLSGQQKSLYLSWGIYQIARVLNFLINDCNLRHNNICMSSIYVNSAGEWKLGGLEYVSSVEEGPKLPQKMLSGLDRYNPPEYSDHSKQRFITKFSSDMWGFGCLIWEAFNGPLPQSSSLRSIEKIPKALIPAYNEMTGQSPANRPNPAEVISRLRRNGSYFCNNLVDALLFLEEIQIKEKNEKNKFFASLSDQLDAFPESICRHKILPQLITAFEYGDAGSPVLAPLFKLGALLPEAEYQKKIVPCVVKLFSSNDRATRIRLLQQLELFISHLQPSTVNDQIFPQLANGFMDTNPTIREQTVKSFLHLAPKLNYNNLNVEVLRHFARLQAKDDQGGIRTNTTVCLGKIAHHLHPQIRQKVLVSAFVRAMRDPFPPARNAGILALAATQQYFLLQEVAARILPALCQLTSDPEKSVRDNAFRTIKGFLGKLEKVSEDPSLKESMEADVNTATANSANSSATWTGWAVSAVTSKFYRSSTEKAANSKAAPKIGSDQYSSGTPSTGTSSINSSIDKEDVKVTDSTSDYEENWEGEGENWGDMDSSPAKSKSAVVPDNVGAGNEGWDTEDWGAIEDIPEESTPTVSRREMNWNVAPEYSSTAKPASSHHPGSSNIDFIGGNFGVTQRTETKTHSDWDDAGWEPLDDASQDNKMDEAKRMREEKRLQRQKELEAKRANRTGGAMKLGSKKAYD